MKTLRDAPLGMVHDQGMLGWPAFLLALLFAAAAIGAPVMAMGAVMKAAEVATKGSAFVKEAAVATCRVFPCTSGSSASTIFADASAAVAGSGAYGAPYSTLAQVEARLSTDASVRVVCMRGTFHEDLDLGDAASSVLTIRGYGAGASIDAGTSYGLSLSPSWGGPDELTVSGISIGGATYAALRVREVSRLTLADVNVDGAGAYYGAMIDDLDELSVDGGVFEGASSAHLSLSDVSIAALTDLQIIGDGASYGVLGSWVDELSVEGVELQGTSYSAISLSDSGALTITDCAFSDVGSYAVTADDGAVAVSGSIFEGYGSTGLDLDVDSAIVSQNMLYGDIAYHGIVIRGADTTSVFNNFILDHEVAGLDVGECDDTVSVRHNSFRNNGEALRINGGGDHALQVDVYNNIFYSGHGQQAIEDSALVADPDPCDPNACLNTSEPIGYNHDVTLDADYNVYLGDVTSINGHEIDFTYWTANSSYDAHSQEADPLFLSSSDLHLSGRSPAINAGSKAWSVIGDIDGDLRGWQVDVGADEVEGLAGVK
jgi:hypothetical protein